MIFIIGVVTFFNFLVLKLKFENKRYMDVGLDLLCLIILSNIFGGTISGMTVAMIASCLLSIYLYIFPPKIPTIFKDI